MDENTLDSQLPQDDAMQNPEEKKKNPEENMEVADEAAPKEASDTESAA